MGSRFIHNTDDATIICRITSDDKKVFVFRNKKIDRDNNVVVSNGYTEISDEDLKLLEAESSTYQFYAKDGKLTIVDSLPMESMTPEQLTIALKTENAALKRDLAKAQAATGENQQAEIDVLNAHIAEQNQIIADLTKQIEDQQDIMDALNEQLAEETVLDDEKDEEK